MADNDVVPSAMDVLNKAASSLIEDSLKTIDSAKGFLEQQIPDILKQLIEWTIAKDTVVFLGCFTIVIICLCFLVSSYRKISKGIEREFHLFVVIAAGFVGLAFLIPAGIVLMDGLEAFIAPKVWLLEYAYRLVQQHHNLH